MANVVKYANNVKLRMKAPQYLDKRDVELEDPTLLSASGGGDANGPLVDGEFLVLNDSGNWERCTNIETKTYSNQIPAVVVISGAHRTDTMSTGKPTTYQLKPGDIFETCVCDTTGVSPGTPLSLGRVTVTDPTGTGKAKSGLLKQPEAGALVRAVVEAVLDGGWLRCRAV